MPNEPIPASELESILKGVFSETVNLFRNPAGPETNERNEKMTITYLYIRDYDTNENAVVQIMDGTAKIFRGVKPYARRAWANRYLVHIASGQEKLPEKPDETVGANPGESHEALIRRATEGMEHLGFFRAVWPNPLKENALAVPVLYSVSENVFPPSLVWYKTEEAAKKDSDGIDTIYLGPVEVYDPEEIEKIEAEIASYSEY